LATVYQAFPDDLEWVWAQCRKGRPHRFADHSYIGGLHMTVSQTALSNVLKFRQLVDSDSSLQAEVACHVGNGTWDSAAIVEIGRMKGFDFTAQDLAEVMDEDDELSDFELELVAAAGIGGGCSQGPLDL
jgi:predicted ribosomally synthesized peptide with nif11-like leader